MRRTASAALRAALDDVVRGVRARSLWTLLAWQEVRHRYRRSALGPFWLTLSAGLTVLVMGPLYGHLLGQHGTAYLPHLAIGFVTWQFLAALTTDACSTFIAAEGFIRNARLPLTVHAIRSVFRNAVIFAHNAAIVAVVLVAYPPPARWGLALVPVALLAIVVNGVWVSLLLGSLCARFRDIPQIVANVVQMTFFLTPVLWTREMLGEPSWVAALNPYAHFLEIVRAPLVGAPVPVVSWIAVLVMTIVGWLAALAVFARVRTRVAYWV